MHSSQMTSNNLLFLESLLFELSSKKESFPNMNINYYNNYIATLSELKLKIYNKIDAALSVQTATVDGLPGFFTAHDESHFDEVVRYAGLLLKGCKDLSDDEDRRYGLEPYEVFVLLIAIRIHDIGNLYGREGHERACFRIYNNDISVPGESAEKKEISKIAQAHGGRTAEGDKDTISKLAVTKSKFRPRLLAAIVRFADEICENSNRASSILLRTGSLPHHSQIYHAYASSIVSVDVKYNPLHIAIEYQININDIENKKGCEPRGDGLNKVSEVSVLEEIFDRLDKMNLERVYCNRFSRELFTVDSIKAVINIVNDELDILDCISIVLEDEGYPKVNSDSLKVKNANYLTAEYVRGKVNNAK